MFAKLLGQVTWPSTPPICYAPLGRTWGKHGGRGGPDTRRKRLLYRSVYRGNKETTFSSASSRAPISTTLDAAELDQYERLLAASDNDIFDWVSGQAEVPPEADSPVLRKLMAFRVRFLA